MKLFNLKDKNLQYGGYWTILFALLVAILLVINVIASALNIKIDLTEDQFYSLSEKTEAVAKSIDDPIHIYVLEETGLENPTFQEFLTRYTRLSGNINLIYKDPILYPQFAEQYREGSHGIGSGTVQTGSIIVENTATGKFKYIAPTALYNYSTNSYTGAQTQSLAIEEQVTSALSYVASEETSTIYVSTGHSEYTVPYVLVNALEKENFVLEEINLLTDELSGDAYTSLLIYSPHVDFADVEREKVLSFLENGGSAMIFTDSDTPLSHMPNFTEILNAYGVDATSGVTVENTQNQMLSYPTFLLPSILEHEVTSAIRSSRLPIVVPLAASLSESPMKRNATQITPLLTTSSDSWLKTDLTSSATTFTANDIKGPITLSFAIEDVNYLDMQNPIATRMIVMANTLFLDSNQFNLNSTANVDFVTNSFLWLQNKSDSLYISPKVNTTYMLTGITNQHVITYAAITMLVIPIGIIVFGIVVWLKRRHL
jgi:hypothetical protein